jgi:hypothetical protein
MVERAHCHTQATVAVARKLVERTWTVLHRSRPYQLRDLDGKPITTRAAKKLIAERFTVPEALRARARAQRRNPPGQTHPLNRHLRRAATRPASPRQAKLSRGPSSIAAHFSAVRRCQRAAPAGASRGRR